MQEKVIDNYGVESEGIKTDVKIIKEKGKFPRYHLDTIKWGVASNYLKDYLRAKLITDINLSEVEILDPKEVERLKKIFLQKARQGIKEILPNIKENIMNRMVGNLLQEMLGLGDLEFLLNDSFLEEIVITSGKEFIKVYHKKHGWLGTNIKVESEEQIQNYSNIIARRVGRQITTLNPLLDAHLVTGDRANAVLYPISTKGNTITIRKFARDPWTVTDFIRNNTCSSGVFALIWMAMQYEMNILVSGGTASGKTSLLNVILPFISPNQRILSIEDTRELYLPEYLYWAPLTTRQPNPEGKGAVTELDLLVNALRMRPDRIILGEMRKKEQAAVLFEAMHTGHSVYATVHADSIDETIKRLANPPIEVPMNLLTAVNLNLVMFRDRRKGLRRVFQVGEFVTENRGKEAYVRPNILYRWKPEKDNFIVHSDSLRLFEELNIHTGFTLKEINKEIMKKKKILDWMAKHNLRGIGNVGKIMNQYYLDNNMIESLASKNKRPDKFLKQ